MAIKLASGTWRNGTKTGTANPGRYERAIIQIGQSVPEAARLKLEAVAQKIVDTAKQLAPKESRELENAINWRWQKTRRGWQIKIRSTGAKNAKGVSYGQYAEWDPLFNKELGTRPFLYPAFDEYQDEISEAVADAAVEVIKRYGY